MNSDSKPMRRPRSLFEVATESDSYTDFGHNLRDFLHQFADTRQRGLPLPPLLAQEPPRLAGRFAEGRICDAFLGATADYLSRINRVPTPAWALAEDLVLEIPWFSPDFLSLRGLLFRDTPSPFKEKNIFIFDSALSVA